MGISDSPVKQPVSGESINGVSGVGKLENSPDGGAEKIS